MRSRTIRVMKLSCYRKCLTTIAQRASDNVLEQNRILTELTRSNRYLDSFVLFTKIHSSQSLRPDHYTLSTALVACANHRDIAFGSQLHAHAFAAGLKSYPHVANTLLSLYAKLGDLDSVKRVFEEIQNPDVYSWTTLLSTFAKLGYVEYACEVFDKMPQQNLACWNAVITGFAGSGHDRAAINMFSEMQRMGFRHDNYTFASVLSLSSLEVDFGRQVHCLVIKTGFYCKVSVINALLTMYFNFRSFGDAYEIFEEAEFKMYDQITFNVMIDGLVGMGRHEEALIMFREMQEACLRPTELTFVSIMNSCLYMPVADQVHSQAIKWGFMTCTSVSNAAITMYSICGDLNAAYVVFQELDEKDIISWNTMISTYGRGNFCSSVIFSFQQMRREGMVPDEFTFGSLVASSEVAEIIEMVQALALKNGLILKIEVLNALVSAYSKHGKINQAYQIFKGINPKNLISWNTIISGFLLNGLPVQGLEQFSELVMSELKPNVYTLSIVLSICCSISALRIGKQVHGFILRLGIYIETSLGNGLITMYANCGVLDWSLKVFNVMVNKDIVSWNSLISAYAQHGQGKEAVHCFEAMQEYSQVKPDQATFTALLSACSHTGLFDDATKIFNSMVRDYGFTPSDNHLSCIVDLVSRAGYLDEAETIIQSKHFEEHSNIWWTLFSACVAYGNLRLGKTVAGFLIQTEHNNPSVYVLLSNIYATTGHWEEATNVRELMMKTGATKQPGCSWIS